MSKFLSHYILLYMIIFLMPTVHSRQVRAARFSSDAGCTLLPREPETRRERECRWEHLPRCGSSRVSLALVSRLVKVSLF